MSNQTRRHELGKYFLDISKYVFTVVVIGAIASEKIDLRAVLLGVGIGVILGLIGFWTLPKRSENQETKNGTKEKKP